VDGSNVLVLTGSGGGRGAAAGPISIATVALP